MLSINNYKRKYICKFMTYPGKMGWNELEKYVFETEKYRHIVEKPKITCGSISELFDQGWRVNMTEMSSTSGLCIFSHKRIVLGKNLIEYLRDKVLFHELVHAHYPVVLNDLLPSGEKLIRSGVVEYVARTLRANPEILKHTIEVFGLEPQIYDGASFIAFSSLNKEMLERQIPFEFDRNHFNYLRKVYLDNVMMNGF